MLPRLRWEFQAESRKSRPELVNCTPLHQLKQMESSSTLSDHWWSNACYEAGSNTIPGTKLSCSVRSQLCMTIVLFRPLTGIASFTACFAIVCWCRHWIKICVTKKGSGRCSKLDEIGSLDVYEIPLHRKYGSWAFTKAEWLRNWKSPFLH